jgi:hypothetical protein
MVARSRERGFSLVVAIAVVAGIGLAVLVVAQELQTRFDAFRLDERQVTLTALSDAALAATLARLSVDPDSRGIAPRALGPGTIASRVERVSPTERRVRALAQAGRFEARLDATVLLSELNPRVVAWQRRFGPRSPGSGELALNVSARHDTAPR